MLTRLRADGFKSLADLDVTFPGLVAIVGPNASGKSNVFDAISLLSRLVTMPLAEALAQGRGEPEEQFRRRGDGSTSTLIRLEAELLLQGEVTDDFDQSAVVDHNRLRYELHIERRDDGRGIQRPYVAWETIRPIRRARDRYFTTASSSFAAHRLRYDGEKRQILETVTREDGRKLFTLKSRRSDGKQQGRPQELPAVRASSTVLSSITTASEYPLLFAVRREIESWRFLQLDPAALRQPTVSGSADDHLQMTGANLAWVLHLIEVMARERGTAGLDDIAADLARVIPGFSGVLVEPNEARGQWETYLRSRDEGRVSARVASDGTLRLVALLAALNEPDTPGVLALEEPENVINPQRLDAMLRVITGLVTDPAAPDAQGQPLSQLLVTSHSPLVLLKLDPRALVVVDSVSRLETGSRVPSRITRARRVLAPQEQPEPPDEWPALTDGELRSLPGIGVEDAEKILTAV